MMYRRRMLNVVMNGVLDGPSNLALDRRLLALAASGKLYDTLRFHRFRPTASVGRHQALARELRLDYCRDRGIGIVRRLSGGGALYLDQGSLGFSLATRSGAHWCNGPLAQSLLKLAWVVARALRRLGIVAHASLPNDVEVGNRKIGSVYAAHDAGILLVHGVLLLEADVRTMLEALKVPTEKLTAQGLATARTRLATIADLRGSPPAAGEVEAALTAGFERMLGVRAKQCEIDELTAEASATERAAERNFASSVGWEADDAAIESVTKTAAGATLRARAEFAPGASALRRVEFATDAHLEPAGFLCDAADMLRGMPVPLLEGALHHLMHRRAVQTCGLSALDLVAILQQLVAKEELRERHAFSTRQVNALMLHTPGTRPDVAALLGKATEILVPYCAKPAWCDWRHRNGCAECGRCEVGEAYRFARERNMRVTTITNYEHLVATLGRMKGHAVPAFVGMCCGHFFVKRQQAFAEAGIPAVLMDVTGANCYELKQEEEAYAGTFSAEAKLDRELLERVIALVPDRNAPPAASGR